LQRGQLVQLPVGGRLRILVGDTRQVEDHIDALQHLRSRHGAGKIEGNGGSAVRKRCAAFAQGDDLIAAFEQLPAQIAPDEPGRSTHKTFHAIGSLSK